MTYDPAAIEKKWQKIWQERKVYSPDLKIAEKPYYNLMMFPYPSAEGLHVGNMFAFTGSDVWGRLMRMRGHDVFEPIGLDGFGIHSENYAIKIGVHPAEQARRAEVRFYDQLLATGNGFTWDKRLETYDPDYYRWTQWLFVQMFKNGLAYRAKAEVNWCPSCKTVLANEQVISGECERCKSRVEQRELEQWFFKITDYADRLLEGLDKIDWAQKVKIAQRNWIGKKEGIEITYRVVGPDPLSISVFTTRPDTNFGATFVVVAPEHPIVAKLLSGKWEVGSGRWEEIKKYVESVRSKSKEDRVAEGRKKTGVFTGLYVTNDLNGEEMPVWISDFVLMEFGTGAVVGVPGHDKRDFEFAKEFGLPVKRVVVGPDSDTSEITRIEQVQEEEGTMVNSVFLDGLGIHDAIAKMMDYLEDKGWGKRVATYHLRDWLISRQRYWGPPIPMVFCQACADKGDSWFTVEGKREKGKGKRQRELENSGRMAGWYPVAEDQLPVELPYVENFKPTGTGKAPLAQDPSFVNVSCPHCGAAARRETDVSDTFLDSAWYFLRYPSVSSQTPWNAEVTRRWLPVHMYIGGAEHSVLHLMYARFVTMALHDWGYLGFEEPFTRFYAHGLLISQGAKMSKSQGNVVVPDEYIEKYGADTLRTYLMFLGPFDQGGDFRDTGIEGMYRFMKRVWRLVQESAQYTVQSAQDAQEILRVMHKTIKRVTEDMEKLRYNRAIAGIMEYVNFLMEVVKRKGERGKGKELHSEAIRTLLLLLAPFAPHMCEELWQQGKELHPSPLTLDASIHLQPWPEWSPELIEEETVEIPVQVNGKLRGTIRVQSAILRQGSGQESKVQSEVEKLAREDERVKKHLAGRKIKKVIFVPGRLLNFVTN